MATGWQPGQPQTTAEGSARPALPKTPRVPSTTELTNSPVSTPYFIRHSPVSYGFCVSQHSSPARGGSPSTKILCECGGRAAAKPPAWGQKGRCTRRPPELLRSEPVAPSRLNNRANESRCQRVRSSPACAGKGESQRPGGGTEEEKPVPLTLLHHWRPGTAAAGCRGVGLRRGARGPSAV